LDWSRLINARTPVHTILFDIRNLVDPEREPQLLKIGVYL